MSALSKIHDYLKLHFAGHDTATLMMHFEAAIEAKVEAAVLDLKQDIAQLAVAYADLRGATNAKAPEPVTLMPAGTAVNTAATLIPPAKQAEIAALPPIAQPDAKVEATTEITK